MMAARATNSNRTCSTCWRSIVSRIMGRTVCKSRARAEMRRIVSGVTASLALIEAAIARRRRCDRRPPRPVLARPGRPRGRLAEAARAAAAGARHQPVCLPPAARCASRARQQRAVRCAARSARPMRASASRSSASAATPPALRSLADAGQRAAGGAAGAHHWWSPGDGRALRRIAWCTGGAQGYFEAAIAAGVDAYVTGEISEPQAHMRARDRRRVPRLRAPCHRALRRAGVGAPMLRERFGLEHQFIEIAQSRLRPTTA